MEPIDLHRLFDLFGCLQLLQGTYKMAAAQLHEGGVRLLAQKGIDDSRYVVELLLGSWLVYAARLLQASLGTAMQHLGRFWSLSYEIRYSACTARFILLLFRRSLGILTQRARCGISGRCSTFL